jgi:hypothetical protein
METLWFVLVSFMLTMYVVLDGFDLGAGIIHLYAAKTDVERRLILNAIGPVWDGNEVWILAAGGTLYFAFPLVAPDVTRPEHRVPASGGQPVVAEFLGRHVFAFQRLAGDLLGRSARERHSRSPFVKRRIFL